MQRSRPAAVSLTIATLTTSPCKAVSNRTLNVMKRMGGIGLSLIPSLQ